MAFATATKNAAVDAIVALGNWISLHTADPGTTGASEASGGTYARQQSTHGASASGVATGTEVTFAGLIAAAYTHFGYWSAVTAGIFRHGNVLTPSMTLGGTGTLKVTPSVTFP
jgi:hypothetical protein